MIYAQAFGEKLVLGSHHIAVVVVRETRPQSVAGFAGPAVADAVGHDDVVARGVEKLAVPEEHIGKQRGNELPPGAGGAMLDEDRVGHATARIALRRSQGGVMYSRTCSGRNLSGWRWK